MLDVTVVKEIPGRKRPRILFRCETVEAAEDWITNRQKTDPEGVAAGRYGIDAPEEKINGKRYPQSAKPHP